MEDVATSTWDKIPEVYHILLNGGWVAFTLYLLLGVILTIIVSRITQPLLARIRRCWSASSAKAFARSSG